jgi:phytoene dehydrogenase-like protein
MTTSDAKNATRTAHVIGAGVNGLSAAIVLATAGFRVDVWEAEAQAGGAARTLPLTLPGFQHDFGAAVLPTAAGSPFLLQLPLHKYGLEWVHAPAPLAHPLDDGTAVVLERDLAAAAATLGEDGHAWRRIFEPLATRWPELAADILRPIAHVPSSPFLLARFGLQALQPASWQAGRFKSERTRALWAGMAAHSFLSMHSWGSAAAALVLGAQAHAVGWPEARGGTQALTNALVAYLAELQSQNGGELHLNSRVQSLMELPAADLVMCDVTAGQLAALAQTSSSSNKFSDGYKRTLRRYRPGPGVFKVDYALSAPIPWRAPDCGRALTVHLGGSFAEIAASEKAMAEGRLVDAPFVLLAQPTLFDDTRAPAGKHIAWAYCHVPYGCTEDRLAALEGQIERFAPGFRECVLARRVLGPAELAAMDANLAGGDISGGAMDLRQLFVRPTVRGYATSDRRVWLCSSSTPPGGGVHGMCGANAAAAALRSLR